MPKHKRSKRRKDKQPEYPFHEVAVKIADLPPEQQMSEPTNEAPPPVPPSRTTLESMRAQATQAGVDAAHSIAQLEAWRDEIDATIAFLKANRR